MANDAIRHSWTPQINFKRACHCGLVERTIKGIGSDLIIWNRNNAEFRSSEVTRWRVPDDAQYLAWLDFTVCTAASPSSAEGRE